MPRSTKHHYVVVVSSRDDSGEVFSVHGHWYSYKLAEAYEAKVNERAAGRRVARVAHVFPATLAAVLDVHA